MINHTIWHPDTCGCRIILRHDDADDSIVAVPSVTTTQGSFTSVPCSVHAALPLATMFSTVRDENSRRQKVYAELAKVTKLRSVDTNGVVFFDETKAPWSFDAGTRAFRIRLSALNNNERRTVQDTLDSLFGAGKVIVE